MASSGSESAISRLLDEISWEGNAKKYRGGGRHLENVMTAEVFSALDLLPRSSFLGTVLMDAHGAATARREAAAQAEDAGVDILPGDLTPHWQSGDPTGWRIQPDVLISTADTLVYVEAKAIGGGKFSARQVARSLHATLDTAGDRSAVLLLVLAEPPPLAVKGHGRRSISDALDLGLDGFPENDVQRLRDAVEGSVAWTTWDLIARSVQQSLRAFASPNPSIHAGITRIAASILNAIHPPG